MFKRFKLFVYKFRWWLASFLIVSLTLFYFILPDPLFDNPLSTIVTSAEGEMIAAKIASDGQWRFPANADVPEKFKECILKFEDRYFYKHPGINPIALFSALKRNIINRRIINGGSTLTMQVIRLARKGKSRTYSEKLIELTLALRLECSYSKDEILSLYASNAPFGGNVVGLEAAARRYYGRSPEQLSWAESATLAVLPNAPSLIYPGKNSELLLQKRNRLLKLLFEDEIISKEELGLAEIEALPGTPLRIPQENRHLLQNLMSNQGEGKRFVSSIVPELQSQVIQASEHYRPVWEANGVSNAAVMITEIESGKVLAYMGNLGSDYTKMGRSNDMIQSHRSSGSILKPFLFAAMMQDGNIYPKSLQADIPTEIGGYSPKNYDLNYSGAVPARNAIARSLNVPAVRMLSRYGVARFHYLLKKLGMSTLKNAPSHYGLSLILGGAETTIWDLSQMYASLALALNHSGRPDSNSLEWKVLSLVHQQEKVSTYQREHVLSPAVIYEMFEAMSQVNRPDEQAGWSEFLSKRKIAWKTGTSFGHRDAWAVGVTPRHVVSVWVGNASGEGKPLLTGVSAAGPLLFDVLSFLPAAGWFHKPVEDMVQIAICQVSGDRAGEWCSDKIIEEVPKTCLLSGSCRFHHLVHLDVHSRLRANLSCNEPESLEAQSFFTLPPLIEYYYKIRHPEYLTLPPWKPGCNEISTEMAMQFIYPPPNVNLRIPKSYDGKSNSIVAEIAHRSPNAKVFWFLNGKQLPSTRTFHQQALQSEAGEYILLAVDEFGNRISRKFSIVSQ
ncbi:MAG: penicillin-binding protein 1C [Bacteroidia bacterium]